ncbi:hypothetical protein [Thiocapsa rosea]|uniref:Secreted protein n=1 Tax=Thiocapsa rosea TaxID=69360 RepID=A0A495UKU9_9GAMM|nr:hypothetical protein [Thiocapsa rosea]RKT37916.1 hypothetical protein BDD21_5427 [Thiocapsa rosea]
MTVLKRLSILTLTTTLGAAAPAYPLGVTDFPHLAAKTEPKPIDELKTGADVSAPRIVVGVMLEPRGELANERSLIAGIPEGWQAGESICARFLSDDALYEGLVEYDVTAESRGKETSLDVVIKDNNWDALSKLGPEELAVAVTRGRCGDSSSEHAVSLWRIAPEEAGRCIIILVNSQDAREVSATVRRDGDELVSPPCDDEHDPPYCEPVPGGADVGFDRRCRIAADLLEGGQINVEINRMTMGTYEDPVEITIDRPVAQ